MASEPTRYLAILLPLADCFPMPMIDVYAAADLFPAGADGQLGHELTMAVLRAEGVATPGAFHLNNTAAFIHRMDPHAVHTAATDSARTVRVQVITPPAALTVRVRSNSSKKSPRLSPGSQATQTKPVERGSY